MPYANVLEQREYQRNWVAEKRSKWLAANGPCKRCGSWLELTIDHIDPTKKVSHKVWSWSEERRLVELAKCQILCEDCHKGKTAKSSKNGMAPVGTHWCGSCLSYLPIASFGKVKGNKLRGYCNLCRKKNGWK